MRSDRVSLYGRGFGNMFGSNIFGGGIFGNNFPTVIDELPYSKLPVVDIVENILDLFRDMESDKLIYDKELAEIEAKVDTYTQYVDYHRDTLNKSYELERKELELIQIVTAKSIGLLERMEKLNDDSSNYKTYMELMNRYQKILEKLIDNSGRYFNERTIEVNRIGIPEFYKNTEIGRKETMRKRY